MNTGLNQFDADWVKRMQEQHSNKEPEKASEETKKDPPQITTTLLPFWPEEQRCAPNEILRSSLFAVVKKGDRLPLQDVKIAAWGDDEIYFTGVQLDQYDLDVWLQLLHLHQESGAKAGLKVYFTLRSFLKALSKAPSGQNIKALKLSFRRLAAGGVRLRSVSARRSYQGSLIADLFEDEETGMWCVILNPKMLHLFTHATTWMNWAIRKSLSGSLTKWFLSWICGHKALPDAPQRIKLENIQKGSGCSYENLRYFKRSVVKALKELQEKKVLQSWQFDENNTLSVVRSQKELE